MNPESAVPGVETLDNALFLLEKHFNAPQILRGTEFIDADSQSLAIALSSIVDAIGTVAIAHPLLVEASAPKRASWKAPVAAPTTPEKSASPVVAKRTSWKPPPASAAAPTPSPSAAPAPSPEKPPVVLVSPETTSAPPRVEYEGMTEATGSGAAGAIKPAQSAAARAKALKNRRSVNRKTDPNEGGAE